MDYPIRTLQQLRPMLIGLRKQAGLSQNALASLLGITQQSYARIEANPSATSVERLFTILRLLNSQIVLTQRHPPHTENQSAEIPPPEERVPAPAPSEPPPQTAKKRRPAPPKMVAPSEKQERW